MGACGKGAGRGAAEAALGPVSARSGVGVRQGVDDGSTAGCCTRLLLVCPELLLEELVLAVRYLLGRPPASGEAGSGS